MKTQASKPTPKTTPKPLPLHDVNLDDHAEPITHYFPDDFGLEEQVSFALDSLRVVEAIFRGHEPDLDAKENNAIGVLTSWAIDLLDHLDLPELAEQGVLKRNPRQEEG